MAKSHPFSIFAGLKLLHVMRKALLLGWLIIAAAQLFAQVDTLHTIDTSVLEEAVVTGTKTFTAKRKVPFSISKITRQQIENTGHINILPVLNNYVPAVFVTERNILGFGVANGGSGGINIRGIGGSPNTGVLVLIDGHPQFQGIFGHPLADAYVASDIQKVEVIRGPASMLYGTNAMGGVVNIITRKNERTGFNGSAGASYGSYNTQKYYTTAGYRNDRWDVFASINHDKTDGLRDSTDFKVTNGYTKIGYQINDHFNATADFMIAKYDANDNGPIHKPAFFNIDILRGKTSLTLANKFSRSDGALQLYYNFGNHKLSSGFTSNDMNHGLQWYQTFRWMAGNNITFGTDLSRYGGKANDGMAKDTLKAVNEAAVYVNVSQALMQNKLMINAGIRIDHSNVWGTELVPVAGASFMPVEATVFRASVSKGFRSPTIMELYLYFPNPGLKPEKTVNYELSWQQFLLKKQLDFELTGYLINGSNLIQVTGNPPHLIRQNVSSIYHKGVEISLNYMPLKHLHLHANYSYLYQKKVTLAAPRHQFNINGSYTYKACNFFTGLQYIDRLYSNLSPAKIQYYALWNARVNVAPFKHFNVFAAANNILNRHYEINYGYPMPGRNYSIGIGVRL